MNIEQKIAEHPLLGVVSDSEISRLLGIRHTNMVGVIRRLKGIGPLISRGKAKVPNAKAYGVRLDSVKVDRVRGPQSAAMMLRRLVDEAYEKMPAE